MFWGAFGPRGSIPAARTFRIKMASMAFGHLLDAARQPLWSADYERSTGC